MVVTDTDSLAAGRSGGVQVEHATSEVFKNYWPWREGHRITTRMTINHQQQQPPNGTKAHRD